MEQSDKGFVICSKTRWILPIWKMKATTVTGSISAGYSYLSCAEISHIFHAATKSTPRISLKLKSIWVHERVPMQVCIARQQAMWLAQAWYLHIYNYLTFTIIYISCIAHALCSIFWIWDPSSHSAVVTFVRDILDGWYVGAGGLEVYHRVQQGSNVLTRFAQSVAMRKRRNNIDTPEIYQHRKTGLQQTLQQNMAWCFSA